MNGYPSSPLFQAVTANVNPWTEAKVDTKNPESGAAAHHLWRKQWIATFLTDGPQLLRCAQQAGAGGGREDLRPAAHTLKSSAGSAGAVRLAAVAERAARETG